MHDLLVGLFNGVIRTISPLLGFLLEKLAERNNCQRSSNSHQDAIPSEYEKQKKKKCLKSEYARSQGHSDFLQDENQENCGLFGNRESPRKARKTVSFLGIHLFSCDSLFYNSSLNCSFSELNSPLGCVSDVIR